MTVAVGVEKPRLTREDALRQFRALVANYGWRWGPNVPAHAYERLEQCNLVLTQADRIEAVQSRL